MHKRMNDMRKGGAREALEARHDNKRYTDMSNCEVLRRCRICPPALKLVFKRAGWFSTWTCILNTTLLDANKLALQLQRGTELQGNLRNEESFCGAGSMRTWLANLVARRANGEEKI